MIIVKLTGGLGNQIFQYALGRMLAEKHSTILKLDVSGFEVYKLHRYSLHCFYIWEYLATQQEIDTLLAYQNNPLYRMKKKVFSRFNIYKDSIYWKEKFFHFDELVLNAPNNIILDGYWQSEKYFSDISDILHRELIIKYQQDPQSYKFAQLIENTESISLHIRRMDYVQDKKTSNIHGICSETYYSKAVQYIATKINNPHFFIFSDEPEWAKHNLQLEYPITVVDCNDASRNYEDLRLMSMCKHNIVANSSFSWWGAWLNVNPKKIIIAPKQWFNDTTRNTKDLIPESWIKI